MANDARADIKPMKYHSCDTPRGMCYYIVDDLTKIQQGHLNELKIKIAKDNKQYLQAHPEIKACISLLTRHMFQLRPKKNIYECVAKFFARSRVDIEEEIADYIASTKPSIEGDSAIELCARSASEALSSFEISTLMSEEFFYQYSQSMQNIDLQNIQEVTASKELRSISQAVRTDETYEDTERLRKIALQEMMEDIISKDIIAQLKEGEGGSDTSLDVGGVLQQKVSFCPTVTVSRGPKSLIFSQPSDDNLRLVLDGFDDPNTEEEASLGTEEFVPEPRPVMEQWINQERPGPLDNIVHLPQNIQSDKALYSSIRKHGDGEEDDEDLT